MRREVEATTPVAHTRSKARALIEHSQPTPERDPSRKHEDSALAPYSALSAAYGKRIDEIDKKMGLTASLARQPRLSTGLLSFDLMLGNGLVPGMTINFGAEQSAKSTGCMTTLKASLKRNIPVRKYFDAEGAVDRKYTGNILGVESFASVFGERNRSGRWSTSPRCLYHLDNQTEAVFRDMHRTAKMLPDKVYSDSRGEWFLVFEKDTDSVSLLKELVANGAIAAPDKTLFTSTGKYWCSVGDDDAPQAAFFVDSLPALVPEKVDDDEKNQGLAIDARVLGQYLKRVRGLLRPKAIIMNCVNQLRKKPMAKPGQADWYEPAGEAVKYSSDARTMFTTRVPMDGFPRWKDNRGLCIEDSVEFDGGVDLYAFKGMTNFKNKYGTPFRKTSGRVWIKDGEGEPRGFDPVYDTFRFLETVGAIEGFVPTTVVDKRKKFRIALKPVADIDWTWKSFKLTVLGQEDGQRRLLREAHEMGAPVRFNLRAYCRKLLDSGKSEDMLAACNRRKEKSGNSVDLEAASSDEEE